MGWPNDGFESLFLTSFFVGLLYTVASFLLGLGHGHGGGHPGDLDQHAGHGEHHGHNGHGGDPAGHQAAGQSGAQDGRLVQARSGAPSPLNLTTIMAFLTWFGGAGYIARAYGGIVPLLALLVALLAGGVGAALVFAFLGRILYASERVLDPEDYYLPGTLARVTSTIRGGGTGEIIFSKGDTRQVSGARSVDGVAIERGTDVVILRYERGLAFVQRWDELMREETDHERPPPLPTS